MVESLHVCGYERCGKSFASPLRLTDLSRKPRSETYYACPYCFSRMDECDHDVSDELQLIRKSGYDEETDESPRKNVKSAVQKELGNETVAVQCPHQMGYLRTRSKDQAVPDTCLTCPKILQCMI